ncbi:hypothetical protein ANCCAN_13943 [Ancylostoma caninum]|uniref:Uncharacterized protein n=1 Tax=Ancylostoma caninum TaxID=29170 RepID=A0A368G6R2_ANCCA|nr:hypothetical protein ANCCAN_13943 [Ancylostoma caninum]
MKDTLDADEYGFNATLDVLINNYLEDLFKSFDNPIARNYFDSLFYNEGEYVDLWTMDSSVLFTATTLVPVGRNVHYTENLTSYQYQREHMQAEEELIRH